MRDLQPRWLGCGLEVADRQVEVASPQPHQQEDDEHHDHRTDPHETLAEKREVRVAAKDVAIDLALWNSREKQPALDHVDDEEDHQHSAQRANEWPAEGQGKRASPESNPRGLHPRFINPQEGAQDDLGNGEKHHDRPSQLQRRACGIRRTRVLAVRGDAGHDEWALIWRPRVAPAALSMRPPGFEVPLSEALCPNPTSAARLVTEAWSFEGRKGRSLPCRG